MSKGYSRWAITQPEALYLRRLKEPGIDDGLANYMDDDMVSRRSFFPGRPQGGAGGGGRGGRGGQGGYGGGRRGRGGPRR